jgi:hypothetical protein
MGLRDRLRLLVRGQGAPPTSNHAVRPSAPERVAPPPPLLSGWAGPQGLAEPQAGATIVESSTFAGVIPPSGAVCVVGPDAQWSAAVAERISALGHQNVHWQSNKAQP